MNDLKAQLQKLSSSPPNDDLFPSISSIESHNSDHSQLMRPLLVPGFSPVLTSFSSDLQEVENAQLKSDFMEEIHQRYGSMKKLEENLMALKQTFLQMGGLVDLQGEELSDIEKNMVESLSFIKIAVGETAGAKEERKSAIATKVTAASVAITLVFLLLIVGLIILLLLLFIP